MEQKFRKWWCFGAIYTKEVISAANKLGCKKALPQTICRCFLSKVTVNYVVFFGLVTRGGGEGYVGEVKARRVVTTSIRSSASKASMCTAIHAVFSYLRVLSKWLIMTRAASWPSSPTCPWPLASVDQKPDPIYKLDLCKITGWSQASAVSVCNM